MKFLRHILRDYTNIQLFCGTVFLRCGYTNAVFSVNDLYDLKNINYIYYRNLLYWDEALKLKNSGISACIKHAFWAFLDYGFNTASKTGNLSLNTAFIIMRF